MIDGLKPYPAYRDSGVPWLGAVPGHWELQKLKRVVSFSGGGTPSKANAQFWRGAIPWVSPKDMTQTRIVDSRDHITEEAVASSATSVVTPGALLMVVRSGILRRTIPVGINTVDVALNQDMKALRSRTGVIRSEYLLALVQGNEAALILEWTKQGATVESIEHELLANSPIPLPPLSEQAAIVRFLDHADRRVRRYIRAKQRLIKLLEEQKQAIIHRAVTRGLDPKVRLKPSGVEWLGDVPEHWDQVALGRCLRRIEQGWSPVAAEGEIAEDQWAVLTLSSVRRGMFIASAIKPIPASATIPQGIAINDGDLLLTRSNTRDLVGDVCLVKGARPKTIICDLIYRLTPALARFDPRFLMYQVLSPFGRIQIESDARGSSGTMPKIAQRHIRAWRVLVPPLDEQRSIVCRIESSAVTINDAQKRAQAEIDLLREYRTRLIADVVTGKLDVREATAALPEVDPPATDDEPDTRDAVAEADGDDLDAIPKEVEA
jgi:type I restriction enzyme, S subunit